MKRKLKRVGSLGMFALFVVVEGGLMLANVICVGGVEEFLINEIP